jgi:hypothetical protein
MSDATQLVLDDIAEERVRQDLKWGIQHYPDGTNPYAYKRLADNARAKCDLAAENKQLMWIDILLEEMYEAFAEKDWPYIRKELVQAAAVIVAWVEDGDSRS